LKGNILRSLAAAAAVASLLCAAGCSVPLAPGYRIAKETRRVRFVPGQPPALAVRVDYTLVNSGNSELNFIDVQLPSEKDFGRSALRVDVNGQAVSPAPLPPLEQQAEPAVVRINFEKPWQRKQKRELSFKYTLRSPADYETGVTIEPAGFHLGLRGWVPQLRSPKHFLSPYPARPSRVDCTFRVPADFAILAGGARRKQKKIGDEIEYRYEVGPNDLEPFVVAGRYVQWPAQDAGAPAKFWTVQPLNGNAAQAAQKVADVWQTFNTDFGQLDKRIRMPAVAESSAVPANVAGERGPAAASFPGGALVNPAALALGIDSDRFVQIVSEALARGWFDGAVEPSAEAEIGIGEGLPEYASIVADEARNGPLARRQQIYAYLRRYDRLARYADETPIAGTTFASPLAQRRIALAKAPLFYIELEDACGEAPVRAGLAHMLTSLRGQEVDYNVLRSVLEESTGRELGKIFRQWLHEKGIPENFRARYRYGEGAEEMGD
jgi:hypothetical protein